MRILLSICLFAMLAACQAAGKPVPLPTAVLPTPAPGQSARVVAYYPSWAEKTRGVAAADLPAGQLTQIIYAFALPGEDASCQIDDPAAASVSFPALRQQREQHPGLELMIAVAGYGYDAPYQAIVASPQTIQQFVSACLSLVTQYDLDGLDLDWEYPKIEQKAAYTALLVEFRRQLAALGQAAGRHYRLTIAGPAGSQLRAYDLAAIAPLVDWINVMTYDYYGTWIKVTGFNAPLYIARDDPQKLSADVSLQSYLAGGVPPGKLLLGIPFYGRGWAGVDPQNNGLFQPYTGPLGKGTYDYREIKDSFLPTHQRYWEELAQAPWLYDPVAHSFIAYDDPQSVGLKAAYARQHGLGGVMIWQIAGDDPDHSLLRAILAGWESSYSPSSSSSSSGASGPRGNP